MSVAQSEALSAGFATEASARTAKQWFRDSSWYAEASVSLS